jgi:hypothetical protein
MSERTDVGMWQRLLDRYVPVLQDLPSTLDRADGVGRTLPEARHAADRTRPAAVPVQALKAS